MKLCMLIQIGSLETFAAGDKSVDTVKSKLIKVVLLTRTNYFLRFNLHRSYDK